ncbi:MAG: hypothetical protein CL920_39340 [Deltaproteobacteria bacterium]|nr:hypothetical protein [Deltaproteobacteria bacterium]MBU54790.1 hypothetical protein [Deltaproteobacteria bacterium]
MATALEERKTNDTQYRGSGVEQTPGGCGWQTHIGKQSAPASKGKWKLAQVNSKWKLAQVNSKWKLA